MHPMIDIYLNVEQQIFMLLLQIQSLVQILSQKGEFGNNFGNFDVQRVAILRFQNVTWMLKKLIHGRFQALDD